MGNSLEPPAKSKDIHTEELISITENIHLTKKQYQVLNIICNTYEESISQYLEEALVLAMRFDIEEGNFCEALLENIDSEYKPESNSSQSSPDSLIANLMNSNLDVLKKLQTQIS